MFRCAALGGTLSVAESYLQNDWDCDDLVGLFRIFTRNRNGAERIDRGPARLAKLVNRLFHWWHENTPSGSRRNIGAHYNLGNDFFQLWLDETMAYSCGIFKTPGTTLKDASLQKFDVVCQKLDLQPSDSVLEIGTGWGGFAVHAASNYGCQITSTTISSEQFHIAQRKTEAAGLSHQIRLLQQDYRHLTGKFDKLVSIEMIEAVGHKYLDDYFRQCGRLLADHGSLLIQAIVMPDRSYQQYLRSVDFIQRYIFPGGSLPSIGAMLSSVSRTTDLRLVHVEDYTPHYAETLRRWRASFVDRLDDIRQLGYSERFIRMWMYYLCYCEAAFEERCVGLVQLRFDKPLCRNVCLHTDRRGIANSLPPPRWASCNTC